MAERWYLEYRLAWIKESVQIFGHINREHVVRKFGISKPQASMDLQETLKRWPELMSYNASTKRYEYTKEVTPQRMRSQNDRTRICSV